MDRPLRFELFLQRLKQQAAVTSADAARDLMESCLNQVEDEHSGVPFAPQNWQTDGRMYPPQDDRERASGKPAIRRFQTRGHWIEFGDNGAIRISAALPSRAVVLDKPGADGRAIQDL
jgi:hypothetical protein